MTNSIHHLNYVCLPLRACVSVCKHAVTASQLGPIKSRSVLFAEPNQGLLACLTLIWVWDACLLSDVDPGRVTLNSQRSRFCPFPPAAGRCCPGGLLLLCPAHRHGLFVFTWFPWDHRIANSAGVWESLRHMKLLIWMFLYFLVNGGSSTCWSR